MNVRRACAIVVSCSLFGLIGSYHWYVSQAAVVPTIRYPAITHAPVSEAVSDKVRHGRELFLHQWSMNDELSGDGDGLGPVCNANSCSACHFKGGTGGAGDVEDVMSQLGLNTPSLFGAGLIDQIPATAIRMNPQTMTVDQHKPVGRFGWKGQFSTLREFVGTAAAVELGLTNDVRHQHVANRTNVDTTAGSDLSPEQLDALVAYCADLPRPRQIMPEQADQRRSVMNGEYSFVSLGCASCHTPNLGGLEGVYSDFRLYHLNDKTASDETWDSPYSDHDEWSHWDGWKTPALWGVADSAPYKHDGAAKTLRAAIDLHRGDANNSRTRFLAARRSEQADLIMFLKSLRAPRTAESCPPELRGKVHIAPGGLKCY